ncbi:MAG: ribokinase, partial [Actinobacteria bacterium]|nr:ribokinase [Actinomycetota bacterium]
MARIAVVGSLNADLLVRVARHPRPGETLHGSGGEIAPGGKGANQALAAALLGGDVAMVGAVGDDAWAGAATALLRDAGVDLGALRVVAGATGLAIVAVADSGENAIIVIPGANGTMGAAPVEEAAGTIAGADIVVLQGEIPGDGIERAAALTAGRLVVNLAPVLEVARWVLEAADPLVVNEHEAALVLDQLGLPAARDAEAAARALLGAGVRSVVVTLGAEGALVADGDGMAHVASPVVRVVDTTGAGDAFVGALAFRLSQGERLREAAAFAARVGAFA